MYFKLILQNIVYIDEYLLECWYSLSKITIIAYNTILTYLVLLASNLSFKYLVYRTIYIYIAFPFKNNPIPISNIWLMYRIPLFI